MTKWRPERWKNPYNHLTVEQMGEHHSSIYEVGADAILEVLKKGERIYEDDGSYWQLDKWAKPIGDLLMDKNDKKKLINFETEIKDLFLDAKIHAPIHLSGGNEKQLIRLFKRIKKEDWIFSTHRSHYHALLHGIDKEWLKQEILAGRSMQINNKEHKFITSSIVSGCLPIAIGLAMGIKKQGLKEKVWAFIGDMASMTGTFNECSKYAARHELPITFVVECNGLSTNSPTYETWGMKHKHIVDGNIRKVRKWQSGAIYQYCYNRVYPHINCGIHVEFK